MGNHSIACEFCGEDLRGGNHAKDCPEPAYAKALQAYLSREDAYVADATKMWRQNLEYEQRDARMRFRAENPPPPKPHAAAQVHTAPVPATVKPVSLQKVFACARCKDTGVIDTGNNDLPCDCAQGDCAVFNVAGRAGPVSGLVLKTEARSRISLCNMMKYTLHGNETCVHPQGHEGACLFVEHDCPDCGTHHGTCRRCGTTHGDSHSENCPHARRRERS